MMAFSIEELKKDSGLPGPRGNLELLYRFAAGCDEASVRECLAELKDDTANSPEEFVGMCGVLGYALLNGRNTEALLDHLRTYASHASWRVREAVAMALQEIPLADLAARTTLTKRLESNDALVNRAIVAGLCEPKNLKKQKGMEEVFGHLRRATELLNKTGKLTEGEESLKKALGYCWSVAAVESLEDGKKELERLLESESKHVRWILKENLKKNRLVKKDEAWVQKITALIQTRE